MSNFVVGYDEGWETPDGKHFGCFVVCDTEDARCPMTLFTYRCDADNIAKGWRENEISFGTRYHPRHVYRWRWRNEEVASKQ